MLPLAGVGPADLATYRGMVRTLRRQAKAGITLPFALDYQKRFVVR